MGSRTALVLLHGSGGNGTELSQYLRAIPMGNEYNFDSFHDICAARGIQIFTPTAETREYSPAMQMKLTVWFDRSANYLEEGLEDVEDEEGVEKSLLTILQLINAMEADFDHIFLGGFSQGGGVALHAMRKASVLCPKVRGLFTMGSFLVNRSAVMRKSTSAMMAEERGTKNHKGQDKAQTRSPPRAKKGNGAFYEANSAESKDFRDLAKQRNSAMEFTVGGEAVKPGDKDAHTPLVDLPVLMMHGERDELINYDWGKATATNLLLRGVDVRFESYSDLDHEIGEEELKDALSWMEDIIMLKEREEEDEVAAMKEEGAEAGGRDKELSYEEERARAMGKAEISSERLQVGLKKKEATILGSKGVASAQEYSLEADPQDNNVTYISYPANESVLDILVARPVLACGGMFEIQKGRDGKSVFTKVLFASDPDKIAREVGARLRTRMESEGASLNACPIA